LHEPAWKCMELVWSFVGQHGADAWSSLGSSMEQCYLLLAYIAASVTRMTQLGPEWQRQLERWRMMALFKLDFSGG